MARRTQDFQTIRSEGGLLPQDLLRRVLDPHSGLPGTTAEDYHLAPGERLNEVITQSWNRLRKHWDEFRQVAANLPAGAAGTGLTNAPVRRRSWMIARWGYRYPGSVVART